MNYELNLNYEEIHFDNNRDSDEYKYVGANC